ncbi:hypothetical protein APT_10073 (plasmid) [Acetobacter pasteurianus NBRC 101655]|uniref:hypothetical protein n=1 Tax=Acetobacter TaxID=434 RepID=UPI00074D40D9|nr:MULTISPECIES: hypothetical protein [Acetobacter]BAU39817.1 hypothetical protein APT_10073 [Acetobacter pasteurianus NBRC 101655]
MPQIMFAMRRGLGASLGVVELGCLCSSRSGRKRQREGGRAIAVGATVGGLMFSVGGVFGVGQYHSSVFSFADRTLGQDKSIFLIGMLAGGRKLRRTTWLTVMERKPEDQSSPDGVPVAWSDA